MFKLGKASTMDDNDKLFLADAIEKVTAAKGADIALMLYGKLPYAEHSYVVGTSEALVTEVLQRGLEDDDDL